MRVRPVLLGVFVAAFVVVDLFVLGYLTVDRGPSSEFCARLWNGSTNRENRALAAAADFDRAVVYDWLAKETFPGCGVLFRRENGKPWLLFGGQLHAGRVDTWSIAGGERWSFDSPEGGPETPNATVTSDGRVRLIEI